MSNLDRLGGLSKQELVDIINSQERRNNLDKEKLNRCMRRLENDLQETGTTGGEPGMPDFDAREKENHYLYNRLLLESFPSLLMLLDKELRYIIGTDDLVVKSFGLSDGSRLHNMKLGRILSGSAGKSWVKNAVLRCRSVLETGRAVSYNDTIMRDRFSNVYVSVNITPALGSCGTIHGVMLMMQDVSELVQAKQAAETAAKVKSSFLTSISHEIRTPMNAILSTARLLDVSKQAASQGSHIKTIIASSETLLGIINDMLDFSELDSSRFQLEIMEYDFKSLIKDAMKLPQLYAEDKNINFTADIDPGIPKSLLGDSIRIKQVIKNLMAQALERAGEQEVSLVVEFSPVSRGIMLVAKFMCKGGSPQQEPPNNNSGPLTKQMIKELCRCNNDIKMAVNNGIIKAMGGDMTIDAYTDGSCICTVSVPQDVADPAPCTIVEQAETKFALILGEGAAADNLERMLGRLFVKHNRLQDADNLLKEMQTQGYSHVFYTGRLNKDIYTKINRSFPETRFVALRSMRDIFEQDDSQTQHEHEILKQPALVFDVAEILNKPRNLPASGKESTGSLTDISVYNISALVVDDNEINLLVAREILAQYGADVYAAGCGQEALDMAEKRKFDIVFMDHMMPGMDGIETTARLREMGGWNREVPVIALTANAVVGNREKFIESGLSDYISKPIEMREMDRVLLQWLPGDRILDGSRPKETRLPVYKEELLNKIQHAGLLDVGAAVERVCGSEKACLTIVEAFSKSVAEWGKTLDLKIRNKDWKGFSIEVHAQKSALANVGAGELSDFARNLEYAAANGNTAYIEKNILDYTSKISALHKGLAGVFMPEAEKGRAHRIKAGVQQWSRFFEILQKMLEFIELLEQAELEELITEVNTYSFGEDVDAQLDEIVKCIDNFDYDKAVCNIELLLKNIPDGGSHG